LVAQYSFKLNQFLIRSFSVFARTVTQNDTQTHGQTQLKRYPDFA